MPLCGHSFVPIFRYSLLKMMTDRTGTALLEHKSAPCTHTDLFLLHTLHKSLALTKWDFNLAERTERRGEINKNRSTAKTCPTAGNRSPIGNNVNGCSTDAPSSCLPCSPICHSIRLWQNKLLRRFYPTSQIFRSAGLFHAAASCSYSKEEARSNSPSLITIPFVLLHIHTTLGTIMDLPGPADYIYMMNAVIVYAHGHGQE